jgi:two-component system, OmpR family, phosphate regulon response regulator OmpR
MNKSILIIDDDVKITELLSEYLNGNNYNCTSAGSPSEGFSKLKKQHVDLIILDIMLPEMNGFEVCKLIRKDYKIPIIMLTSMAEVTDKVVGLELGADDYIAKPFELRELLARIVSVLRRSDGELKNETIIKFRNFIIDSKKRTVNYYNKDLNPSSTEFELLLLFAKNNGKVLSREEIMQNTRGLSWESFDRSVDVMVSRLRNKLKTISGNKGELIKTVHTIGYMFYADTE